MVLPFPKGMIIAFEGLDCSFKETNYKAFCNRLRKKFNNELIMTESFPRYGNKSAYALEQWLNGKYDRDHLLSYPLARSSFYSIDRFDYWFLENEDGRRNIDLYKNKSTCFVFDRYNFSNSLYNPKFSTISNVPSLDDFRFDSKTFGIPNPTIVVWMRIKNFDVFVDIVSKKEKKDKNELDINFLKETWDRSEVMLALNYGEELGVKIIPIECLDENDNIKSKEELEEEIWRSVMMTVSELRAEEEIIDEE